MTDERSKGIRDPLYDYIEVTPLEQEIIDHQVFQRLRFVSQNSTAYLTYPTCTGTRFSHSLGVMHVSGRMFLSALGNARSEDLAAFLREAHASLLEINGSTRKQHLEPLMKGCRELLGNRSQLVHSPITGTCLDVITPDDHFVINTLWQATRLAGLIHDVGHFPMSHVFEHAVDRCFDMAEEESLVSGEIKLRRSVAFRTINAKIAVPYQEATLQSLPMHEWWGMYLFALFEPRRRSASADRYTEFVLRLAKVLFLQSSAISETRAPDVMPRCRRLLGALRPIVSSEIDADRLDYCVRDPRNAAKELGAVDVERIVRSLTLVQKDGEFKMCPTARGLSAVEEFFQQRYLLYKDIVYHHSVLRMNCVLEEILVRLAGVVDGLATSTAEWTDSVRDAFARFEFLVPLGEAERRARENEADNRPAALRMFSAPWAVYDDAWLRTFLRSLQQRMALGAKRQDGKRVDDANGQLVLRELLNGFLDRDITGMVSCWKREMEYWATLSDIHADLLKRELDDGKRALLAKKFQTVRDLGTGLNNRIASVKSEVLERVVGPARTKLESLGVSLLFSFLVPRVVKKHRGGTEEVLVHHEGRFYSLRECSQMVRALDDLGSADPMLYFAFVKTRLREDPQLVIRCRRIVREALFNYLSWGIENDKL